MFVMMDAVQLQTQPMEISGLQASGFRLPASGLRPGPPLHDISHRPAIQRRKAWVTFAPGDDSPQAPRCGQRLSVVDESLGDHLAADLDDRNA